MRVFLPDKPGSLGSVASRIGAAGGDVTGIEILDRSDGLVLDEFMLDLADDEQFELVVGEVSKVAGTFVEDVRRLPRYMTDAKADVLDTAAVLVAQTSVEDLLSSLVTHGILTLGAKWAAVLRKPPSLPSQPSASESSGSPLASVGLCPSQSWLESFVRTGSGREPDGIVAVAELEAANLVLAIGRPGCPFRGREHKQLTSLARIADYHWRGLTGTWVWKMSGSRNNRNSA